MGCADQRWTDPRVLVEVKRGGSQQTHTVSQALEATGGREMSHVVAKRLLGEGGWAIKGSEVMVWSLCWFCPRVPTGREDSQAGLGP